MPRPPVTQADLVLDAAARRLAAHGIAGTTVDDVGEEAGISRATVYRYVGGKDEIVRAVIGREATAILEDLAQVITDSTTSDQMIAAVVSTSLWAIDSSPVLFRLSGPDLEATLQFITTGAAGLEDVVVSTLSPLVHDVPGVVADIEAVEVAIEEVTRFVLAHISTPRSDGSRLDPVAAGELAGSMFGPLLV